MRSAAFEVVFKGIDEHLEQLRGREGNINSSFCSFMTRGIGLGADDLPIRGSYLQQFWVWFLKQLLIRLIPLKLTSGVCASEAFGYALSSPQLMLHGKSRDQILHQRFQLCSQSLFTWILLAGAFHCLCVFGASLKCVANLESEGEKHPSYTVGLFAPVLNLIISTNLCPEEPVHH